MICLAVVFVMLMMRSMKSLTDSVLSNVLPSMTKTASQNLEGNMHMLVDRIFMIGDNEAILQADSSQGEKEAVLENIKSMIEFVWLGLYDAEGNLYLGDGDCPRTVQDRTLFPLLQETQNLVVDDIFEYEDALELTIGLPILNADGELNYYLVASYNYDILSDPSVQI